MFFIDNILKNLPSIQNNFSCFIIIVSGKSRGGSKRTNSLFAGYGDIPFHSIFAEVNNAFMPYKHVFGAFGIKMLMNRNLKKLAQKKKYFQKLNKKFKKDSLLNKKKFFKYASMKYKYLKWSIPHKTNLINKL
jgi:ribosomal protein S3